MDWRGLYVGLARARGHPGIRRPLVGAQSLESGPCLLGIEVTAAESHPDGVYAVFGVKTCQDLCPKSVLLQDLLRAQAREGLVRSIMGQPARVVVVGLGLEQADVVRQHLAAVLVVVDEANLVTGNLVEPNSGRIAPA